MFLTVDEDYFSKKSEQTGHENSKSHEFGEPDIVSIHGPTTYPLDRQSSKDVAWFK